MSSEPGLEFTSKQRTLDESRSMPVNVNITRVTDTKTDDDFSSGKRASLVDEGSDTYPV